MAERPTPLQPVSRRVSPGSFPGSRASPGRRAPSRARRGCAHCKGYFVTTTCISFPARRHQQRRCTGVPHDAHARPPARGGHARARRMMRTTRQVAQEGDRTTLRREAVEGVGDRGYPGLGPLHGHPGAPEERAASTTTASRHDARRRSRTDAALERAGAARTTAPSAVGRCSTGSSSPCST
jgi:hypothetical protein